MGREDEVQEALELAAEASQAKALRLIGEYKLEDARKAALKVRELSQDSTRLAWADGFIPMVNAAIQSEAEEQGTEIPKVEVPEVPEVEVPEVPVIAVLEEPIVETIEPEETAFEEDDDEAPVEQLQPAKPQVVRGGFDALPVQFTETLPDGNVKAEDVVHAVEALRALPQGQGVTVVRTYKSGLRITRETSQDLFYAEHFALPSMGQILVRRHSHGGLRAQEAAFPLPMARAFIRKGRVCAGVHRVPLPEEKLAGTTMIPVPFLGRHETWRLITVYRAPYGVWFVETDLDGTNQDAPTWEPPVLVPRAGYTSQVKTFAFLIGQDPRVLYPLGKGGDGSVNLGGPRQRHGLDIPTWTAIREDAIRELAQIQDKVAPAIATGAIWGLQQACSAAGHKTSGETFAATEGIPLMEARDFINKHIPEPVDEESAEAVRELRKLRAPRKKTA